MISIEDFTGRFVGPTDWIQEDWAKSSELAAWSISNLPSIGFLSVQKRSEAFATILRHVQDAIADGNVTWREASTAIKIARWSDMKFEKAAAAWIQEARLGRVDRTLLNRFTGSLIQLG